MVIIVSLPEEPEDPEEPLEPEVPEVLKVPPIIIEALHSAPKSPHGSLGPKSYLTVKI